MRGEQWTPEEARERLQRWLAMGWTLVGIDEAGRGPLAGPVVAAAILLPPHGTKGTGQRIGLHELLLAEPPFCVTANNSRQSNESNCSACCAKAAPYLPSAKPRQRKLTASTSAKPPS